MKNNVLSMCLFAVLCLCAGFASAATQLTDGNDFFCTRWGCVGGSGTAALSDWRSVPEGTFPSNFGWTLGLDAAAPVPGLQDYGVGVQFAGSFGQFDLNGRDSAASSTLQRQHFYSFGAFRRPSPSGPWWSRFGAGFAYDIMMNENGGELVDNYYLRQWRLKASYEVTSADEVGVWSSLSGPTTNGSASFFPGLPIQYRGLNQFNFFYERRFDQGGHITVYWGPGVGGSLPMIIGQPYYGLKWTLGGDAVAPFNDYVALYVSGAYGDPATPNLRSSFASGVQTYSVLAGLRFYWGGNARARDDNGRHWMPYLSDPDNGSFMAQSNFAF